MAKVLSLDAADQANFTDADLKAYKAKGVDRICLYVKWSTPKLVQLIFNNGLGIVPIVESTAARAKSGYSGGVADAKAFLASVKTRLGVDALPQQVAVAWTDDEDTTAADQLQVVDYARGWKDGVAGACRLMVYGNGAICEACKIAGFVDFTWVTGGNGMRGTLAYRPKADMYQEVGDKENLGRGHDLDSDVVQNLDPSWVWWSPSTIVVQPPSPSVPTPVPSPPIPVAATDPVKTEVMKLQQMLKDAGLYSGAIDGDPGPATQAALQKWR